MSTFLTNFSFSGDQYLKDDLHALVTRANEFGFKGPDSGVSSPDAPEPGDYKTVFKSIVESLRGQNVQIDDEFYDHVKRFAAAVDMNESEYRFLKNLIRPKSPVTDKTT
jgi:hypothetical protein